MIYKDTYLLTTVTDIASSSAVHRNELREPITVGAEVGASQVQTMHRKAQRRTASTRLSIGCWEPVQPAQD